MTLLCYLQIQAETFAYGLPVEIQNNWDKLTDDLDKRFSTHPQNVSEDIIHEMQENDLG